MSKVTQMKCACEDCLCVVDVSVAEEEDRPYYCSKECATGHLSGHIGCGHTDCGCSSRK